MKIKGLKHKQRGMPDSIVCYSSVIRPFLHYLSENRNRESSLNILSSLETIRKNVEDKVFGLTDQENLPQIQSK